MESMVGRAGSLLAVSDPHIGCTENRALVEKMRPESDDDWLLVAEDVTETVADIRWALETLADRLARVIWAPGDHALWIHPKETHTLRSVERYDHLVALRRELGVTTPEDPYPVGGTWRPRPGCPALPVVRPLVSASGLRHQGRGARPRAPYRQVGGRSR